MRKTTWLSLLLTLAMVVTLLVPANVQAAGKVVTVGTQAELEAALADPEVTKIAIKAKKSKTLTIPEGDYSGIALVVEGEKVKLNNYGTFSVIKIRDAKKYMDYAEGNVIKVSDDKLTLGVEKGAEVEELVLTEEGAHIKVVIRGEVDKLTAADGVDLDLTVRGILGIKDVPGNRYVDLGGNAQKPADKETAEDTENVEETEKEEAEVKEEEKQEQSEVVVNPAPIVIPIFTVTFDSGEPSQYPFYGQTVKKPADPVREGYNFLGWAINGTETLFNFSSPVTSNYTLTAKWEQAVSVWDGTVDTSWYNDVDTEFVIMTAAQLAGLAQLVDNGNTFAGKTVKLGIDMDLGAVDTNGNPVLFEPIGDASNADFSGIFDGNGKTIYNLRQDCNSTHVALFGAVYEGTVKNLTLDGAKIENDGSGYAGGIAAYTGASTFSAITLRNTIVVNYNHNTAGIAAWCSNNGTTTTFENINIENTTTIGSWWGSPGTRVGGIVGAMNTENNVIIKNSTVACRLDVYNDVMSNYQWYNYRTAGMVVADVRDTQTVDGRTEAYPARVTCENVTVIFGDWVNYHYCESESYGTPSYADPGEYKFRRVEAGLGFSGVDLTTCNHAEDETHNELIAFNFLFGARDGEGEYGISSFEGVTVVGP